jgi:hypothetical protein
MQRRVKTYGRRSTRIIYIDDAFPPFQPSPLVGMTTSTYKVPSSSYSHELQPVKPSTSVTNGLRKSSKAPVVLSESDSESDLATSRSRRPLAQVSPNLRRPQGHERGPEIAKFTNKESTRRLAKVVYVSSSSESSDSEEPDQRVSTKRTNTAPSRLGARSAALSALRSKAVRAAQPRRTTPAYDLSSDEETQTTSATHAPTTSESQTEGSDSEAPAGPSSGGVSSRPMYTRRTATRTIMLSSSSEEDSRGFPPSSGGKTSPMLTGGY